ncbi:hypothetical protein FA95DRAFT_1600546 [Auriscalpium vulgare]|uniref:Uncharacterized protein n=1 Tax=Auriscalpium vulgare TaxID=40419 RepID=A0ACB8SC76_9AGAM|nr:hypothetical protein FA95DRAFT_1600546 [Auriscalpium vulgare]
MPQGFYKVMRCRYFDDRGHPLKPYCIRGDRCSFIHPTDSNWDVGVLNKLPPIQHGKKPARRLSPVPLREINRSPSRNRRASPLPEQATLFQRVATDDDVRVSHASYDREHSRDPSKPYYSKSYRERTAPRASSRGPPDRRGYSREREKVPAEPHTYVKAHPDDAPRGRDEKRRDLPPARGIDPKDVQPDSTGTRTTAPTAVDRRDEGRKLAEGMIDLFRNVAKYANRATLTTAAYNKEEEKLQTYTELCGTLSKISPSAAAAVNPALTTVVANHTEYRDKLRDDYKRLGQCWEDIFEHLAHGIVRTVDAHLDHALARLQDEADARVTAAVAHTPCHCHAYPSPDTSTVVKRKRDAFADAYGEKIVDSDPSKRRRLIVEPTSSDTSKGGLALNAREILPVDKVDKTESRNRANSQQWDEASSFASSSAQ